MTPLETEPFDWDSDEDWPATAVEGDWRIGLALLIAISAVVALATILF